MDDNWTHDNSDWSAPLASPTPEAVTVDSTLDDVFADDRGTARVLELLADPDVHDIRINRHDRVFFTTSTGPKMIGDKIFAGPAQYATTVDKILRLTDVGFASCVDAGTTVIEGSFRADRTNARGSVFVATSEITRGEPSLVIRKQPKDIVTLDRMLEQGMMSADMRLFLETATRGRLNMLVAGGSGAGKTTLMRALAFFIDPSSRVISVEDIDELHLSDRLPNVVSLTTFRDADETGGVRRQDTLEDLVRHALRLRGDRIWVGETRGKEAYALVKACLSGHDGSVTTVHANSASQAIRQLVSYTMEANLSEEVARDQIAAAFHLAIHVAKVKMGRRVITEIVELEPTREGSEQRRNELWRFDFESESFVRTGTPSPRLRSAMERANVNLSELDDLLQAGLRRRR